MKFNFPENFIWGTATAAHQVEGNNKHSDFWLLEKTEGSVFAEPSGIACDHWNKYKEDIDLMADNCIQSYRMSIEWARIEPSEGEFSSEAIDHYKSVLNYCHKKNLKTCVTYQHFTSPLWFTAKGGWENKQNADYFVKYAEKVAKELGDYSDIICTINEANLTSSLAHSFPDYPEGGFKPLLPFLSKAARNCGSTLENFGPFLFGHPFKTRDSMLEAHKKALPVIKENLKRNQPVGLTLSIMDHQALPGGEDNRDKANKDAVDVCLEQIKDDDFVGVQTYTRHTFNSAGVVLPDVSEMLVMGYEYYPEALENVIRYVDKKVNCPILITENGIGTDNDEQRIEYISTALKGVEKCLMDGIDIKGYFYWSFMDNFEWILGYKPRFGLVSVDRKTLKRNPKKSLEFYKSVIESSCQKTK